MSNAPPLNALRAFEAAARHGSFTTAAEELGVSPAAVSQQVKGLEGFWGKTLFVRQGNRIALTEAGLTAYPQLGQSLTDLRALSDMMMNKAIKRRLVISAPQSIAETWLAARLKPLTAAQPDPAIDIRVEEDPINFARDRIDLRIFYGHDLYGEYRVEPLFSDHLVAVAAPAFATQHGTRPETYEGRFLIHTDWGRDFSGSPNWGVALSGLCLVDQNAGPRVQASSTALQFALQGVGAALTPLSFAAGYLASGQLMRLHLAPVEMEHSYLVAYPKRLARSPSILSLIDALKTPDRTE